MTDAPVATAQLHLAEPLRRRFESVVLGHGRYRGHPSLLLAETAFYAEAGGQLADRGSIDGIVVLDVQIDEGGQVHHLLDGALPPGGRRVRAEIDWPRRREHMALHTGQHMLSQALLVAAGAPTVSSRLGETGCTIDVDVPALSTESIEHAERLVHEIIDADLPIRIWVPEPHELAALPLRRSPKVTDAVRVVQIGTFDVTPCGGTHCTSTGQVALVRILHAERYKGKTRVYFVAGARARRLLFAESAVLRSLARAHSCAPLEVPAAFERVEAERSRAWATLTQVSGQLGGLIAQGLLARAADPKRVVATIEQAPVELLRVVADRLTRDPDAVAMLAGSDAEGQPVLVSRGRSASVHCGKLLSAALKRAGGKGGGRAEHAEGRLGSSARFEEAVREALREG